MKTNIFTIAAFIFWTGMIITHCPWYTIPVYLTLGFIGEYLDGNL